MSKKRAVVSLGHEALGYTTEAQWDAVKITAKALADLVEENYQLTITHSNGPQVSMIHKAMTELRRVYIDYTPAPMCVCSAMSQGYVGYDIQNSLRAELLNRGISKTVSTILTQVTVDPYDEAFYEPTKVIGRYMSREDAETEIKKGNYVKEDPGMGFRRVIAAPKPIDIVEIDAIRTLADADQVVIAANEPAGHESMASCVTHDATLYMPMSQLVDVAKELERIAKEREKAQKGLSGIQAKLNNPGFTAKAPEAVVNAEREKAQKYESLLKQLAESEERLKAL